MACFQPKAKAPGPRPPPRTNAAAGASGKPPIQQVPPGNVSPEPRKHLKYTYLGDGSYTVTGNLQTGNLNVVQAPGLLASPTGPGQVDPPALTSAHPSATAVRQEAKGPEEQPKLIQIEEHHHPIQLTQLQMEHPSEESVRNLLCSKYGIPESWLRGIRLIAPDTAIVHLASWPLAAETVEKISKQTMR